jgi:hypothetical protein
MNPNQGAAKQALIWLLRIGAAAAVLIAIAHTIFGTASIPGGEPVNPTLDGEDRFYAVIFGGYGLALWRASNDVVGRAETVRLLAALFFVGGLARALAWALRGPPHPFFIAMTLIELGLPFVIWRLLGLIARERRYQIRDERSAGSAT